MSGRIFVIGASMQGVEALRHLVERLPSNFPAPILVTQHLGRGSAGYLPRILSRAGPLPAVHPVEPEQLEPSRIYIAPPDRHMLVRPGYIQLSDGPRENYVRPAIDPLFRSAANAYGPAVVGIVLTGELDDGAAGLLAIKDRGGITCVQDPREAYAPSMPQAALQKVAVDYCCTLDKLSEIMIELAKDDPPPAARQRKKGCSKLNVASRKVILVQKIGQLSKNIAGQRTSTVRTVIAPYLKLMTAVCSGFGAAPGTHSPLAAFSPRKWRPGKINCLRLQECSRKKPPLPSVFWNFMLVLHVVHPPIVSQTLCNGLRLPS
ncbi:chemotaxis protein CheB [Cupriavidus sp. EM10]|uniref:chemotaxis protein CheB n=1 Tax=Cupriavidus sp. EM10 TaxID=2839983 RepID=UPI001BFFE0CF|nr:chemotaxis protein CheB [Cupriavidus sp. EM10]QWE97147.1 chemotaxis protein CheB [Cupriavidus sp. EM10]